MNRTVSIVLGAFAGILLSTNIALATDTPTDSSEMSSEMAMEHDHDAIVVLGDLELSGPFTRAMPPAAKSGGGFVTITNMGGTDDRLMSVSSPTASVVELHIMKIENEVMVMQSQPDGFAIPAGETVELAPGGKHMMFMGVTQQFVEGHMVPVTLVFEHAGTVDLMLPVAPIGATGMDHAEHMEQMNSD